MPRPMTETVWRFDMLLSPFRHRLRGKRQLHGLEAARLRDRGLGAIAHVSDELAAIGQFDVGTVDPVHALAVDHDEMVDAFAPGDIDIFAQLDIALGTENGDAA